MRFMMIVKGNADTEAGKMPQMELLEEMGKFNEEMVKAGVLLGGDGLKPTSQGARVHFAPGRKPVVTDGPFTETKEIVGGYWILRVNSKEEAIAWALKCPPPHGPDSHGQIEIRPFYEAEDFGPEIAEQENALREQMAVLSRK